MTNQPEKWATASLRIHSTVFDPEYIAEALQTKPTRTKKMGERMSSRGPNSAIFQSHMWSLESPLSSETDLVDHIKYLVEFIEGKLPALKILMAQCEADLFCGYDSGNDQGGIYLEADMLKRITAIPLNLIFDIYTIRRDENHT